ncbi:hypothetical protein BN946_scf184811.g4 [Trametes cinnabarina]|uniref:Uncharacterized protein n=1 Tax=Pycnoporus cinnabarinus TaxID=5643 RepID=A0A060SZJ6_PYCCI|nr:hypothetical protein BN946_scf184811.g4 [Trametes cinnabarina]
MAGAGAATPLFGYDDLPSSPIQGEGELPLILPGLTSTPSSADSPAAVIPRSASVTSGTHTLAAEISTPTHGRRRRANDIGHGEDLSQHADWAACRVRLKTAGTQELKKIAQLNPAQRELLNTALLLKLSEKIEAIIPSDAQWMMSENLKEKIEQYTFAVLCSPKLELYVEKQGPTKLLMSILERHPSWGYTKDIKNDKYRRDIIIARVGTRFTDRRSDMKELILLSLGPELQPPPSKSPSDSPTLNKPAAQQINIVTLCENIIAKGPRSICEDVTVTLQMCARIAFLRKIMVALLKSPHLKFDRYWNLVDKQLEGLRGLDDSVITRQLTSYLRADLDLYGQVSLPSTVSGEDMHETQQVADLAATGSLHSISEDD